MRIDFFKATWGMPGELADWLPRIAAAGYAGFEMHVHEPLPADFDALREASGLDWVAQLIHADAEAMCAGIEEVAPRRPVLINCHSGRDGMAFDEGVEFFQKVNACAARHGIPIAHETHRGRMLFSPFATRDYMAALPGLRLNVDFSHWMCVCERLLDDVDDVIDAACERAIHVHARVGHTQGPQVSDPRAPEFSPLRLRYESWWSRVKEARERDGAERLIVVPEYGPAPYLATAPFTREPLADLWEVCLWQANRLRELWGIA